MSFCWAIGIASGGRNREQIKCALSAFRRYFTNHYKEGCTSFAEFFKRRDILYERGFDRSGYDFFLGDADIAQWDTEEVEWNMFLLLNKLFGGINVYCFRGDDELNYTEELRVEYLSDGRKILEYYSGYSGSGDDEDRLEFLNGTLPENERISKDYPDYDAEKIREITENDPRYTEWVRNKYTAHEKSTEEFDLSEIDRFTLTRDRKERIIENAAKAGLTELTALVLEKFG